MKTTHRFEGRRAAATCITSGGKVAAVLAAVLAVPAVSLADITQYGDADVLGTGSYASDPTAGATLLGLAAGATTRATLITGHGFPFAPSPTDYAGTDTIYVGAVQTGFRDGYSGYSGRVNGPQIITLNYASLVTASVETLTLGIAADDFQRVPFGNPFEATINGVSYASLTDLLNSLDQTGPVVQFVTVGVPLSLLRADNTLELRINQGGDGGDGWAIDFLTIGVTNIPSPSAAALLGLGGLLAGRRRR